MLALDQVREWSYFCIRASRGNENMHTPEFKAPESSATLQRLRAETTVLGLLFFAFTHVSVSLKRVPLLGVDIEGGAPKGTLLLFIFFFWLFFAVSWLVRYKADRAYERRNDDGIRLFLEQLAAVPSQTSLWNSGDPERLVSALSKALEELQKHNYGAPNASDLSKALKFLTEHLPHENETSVVYDSYRREGLDTLEKMAKSQSGLHGLVQKNIADLDSAIQRITSEAEAARDVALDAVKAVNDTAKRISEELTSMRSTAVWDRIRLGFYLPFLCTVALVVVSLPQATYEAAPVLGRLWGCATFQELNCFLSAAPSSEANK